MKEFGASWEDDWLSTVIMCYTEEHSIEVHNSRPLDRLTLTLTFDLILIDGRGIVMDYLCAKFGNFIFSRFGFIVRAETQTEAHDCYILTRLPSATRRE